jgi:MtN3 and saliva related transmembrane protein
MSILALLATLFGSIMALSNIPQSYKIFSRKSASDISPTTYLILTIGGTVWLLYGLELQNIPIIITNTIGVLTVFSVLLGWFLYGRDK